MMGNYKKVRVYIETVGCLYTSDENDRDSFKDSWMDDSKVSVTKVEVLEEYNLPQHLYNYVNSDELNDELEKEVEREIKSQTRDNKITRILTDIS